MLSRHPRRVAVAAIGAFVFIAITLIVTKGPGTGTSGPAPKPNIVMILTDDQTLEELRVMGNVRTLLENNGASFTHYYSSFPNCCPSRATYYTGQLSHNNGVRDNVAPSGGARKLQAADTLPVWMQHAGYYTAQIGKYLNTWGDNGDITPPPGWTHWFGLIDPTTYHYFNYDVSVDGIRRHYGQADQDYSTDVLGAEVLSTIGTAQRAGQPFYLSFTPLAPHVQSAEKSNLEFRGVDWPVPVPAPRHVGMFKDEPLTKTASWNEPRGSTKPGFIQQKRPLSENDERLATQAYRLELETLQAVDEWVGKIVQALKDSGAYDNTYLLFTSDNGLYHGEHRIPNGKLYFYEPGAHLPLLIAGPGIPKGLKVDAPVGNVDLAPTIAKLGGAQPTGLVMDGRDVLAMTRDPKLGRGRAMLLENALGGTVLSEAVHTERYFYAESNDGTKELYDLAVDPDQALNIAGAALYAPVEKNLRERLATQRRCAGVSCEGSDASGGLVPLGVDLPIPKVPASVITPRSADILSDATVQANTYNALDAITPIFDLVETERTCAAKALSERADTIGTDGLPVLQDSRALVNAITIARPCIGPQRRARGVAALAPLLTNGVIAGALAICLGDAIAKLDAKEFTAALDFLLDMKEPDPEARTAMVTRIQTCGTDPAQVLPR